MIPRIPLLDHFGDWGMGAKPSKLEVAERPAAWVLKNEKSGALYARVCGDCGHTELYTDNHQELYEAYLKASGSRA